VERVFPRGRGGKPVRNATERAQWGHLMDQHHYPGFRSMFGASLRHVVETPGGHWLALIRLVCRRLQGRHAGSLDRPGTGATIPALAPDREQHAVPDPATGAGCQSGLACAVIVVRRLSDDT